MLSKSPALISSASAILYNTSTEKGRTMFGASIELKWERRWGGAVKVRDYAIKKKIYIINISDKYRY